MSELPPSLDLLRRASPSLAELLERGDRGARSESPLLILGESGTGRSTLARALHSASGRQGRPLVEVDPGSIPSALFESEVFGHVAGAFTGAEIANEGRVRRAEGGSLLLDHVEETPITAQAKLLRLLAERRYAPLGGTDLEADVRFLAIAAEDLVQRTEAGMFRPDLYYRLEVLTLRLPPLRERRDDLPALLDYFLGDLAERFGKARLRVTGGALDWMHEYSWPGNLRQLRNLLEREVVLSTGDVVDPSRPERGEGRPETLVAVERRQILRALDYARGHQGRAAEILGISRKALWEKRKRFGLP